MKSAFDRLNLRPFERRLVVGVATVVFVVLNLVFVWPHFNDRTKALQDLEAARDRLAKYEKEITGAAEFQRKVRAIESEAEPVPPEEQGLQFSLTIQEHVNRSGVNFMGNSRETTRTNQFFLERSQTVNLMSTEQQLVDFLYNIGAVGSMIRARDLSLRPDASRQKLSGNIKLVASYQKKTPPKPAPAPVAAKKPAEKTVEKPAVKAAEKAATRPPEKSPSKRAAKTADKPSLPASAANTPPQSQPPKSVPVKPNPGVARQTARPEEDPAPVPIPPPPSPVNSPERSKDKQE